MTHHPSLPHLDSLVAHQARVRTLVRALLHDEHAAEDIVQDAWVQALESGPSDPGAIRAWFERVARHLALNRLRGHQRRDQRERDVARVEALPSSADIAADSDLLRQLLETLEALPEPHRSTLRDRYLGELSAADIAARDGLSLDTVRSRVARGRELMRERLEQSTRRSGRSWSTVFLPLAAPRGVGDLPLTPVAQSATVSLTAGVIGIVAMKKLVLVVALAVVSIISWRVWTAEQVDPVPVVRGDVVRQGPLESLEPRAPALGVALAPQTERFAVPVPAPVLTPEPLRYEGVVVDRTTGAPLAGVDVIAPLSNDVIRFPLTGTVLAQTDREGRFTVPQSGDGRSIRAGFSSPGRAPRFALLYGMDAGDPQVVALDHGARVYGVVAGAMAGTRVMMAAGTYDLYEDANDAARMTFDNKSTWTCLVDEEGKYEFEGLPPHTDLEVLVLAKGRRAPLLSLPESLVLDACESCELNWTIGAGPRIVGRVVEADGTPAEGIEIRLISSSIGRPGYLENYWRPAARATSDEHGAFVFEDVQEGRWIVGPRPCHGSVPKEERYAALALPVEVGADDGDVAVVVELHRGLYVSGIVAKPDGSAILAHVTTRGADFPQGPQETTHDTGAFRVGPFAPGRVIVSASASTRKGRPCLFLDSEPLDVDVGAENLVLLLRVGCALTVCAVDADTGEAVPSRIDVGSKGRFSASLGHKLQRTFSGQAPGRFAVRVETRDGRAGLVVGLEIGAGEHVEDLRVPLELAGTVMFRFERGEGMLGCSFWKTGLMIAGASVRGGRDEAVLLPPGRYTVELVLRDWSDGEPREVHREERVVDVVAGEVTDVLFSR